MCVWIQCCGSPLCSVLFLFSPIRTIMPCHVFDFLVTVDTIMTLFTLSAFHSLSLPLALPSEHLVSIVSMSLFETHLTMGNYVFDFNSLHQNFFLALRGL